MDEVEDSSSPTGDETVGVDEGEIMRDAGRLIPAFEEAKFLNMAKIESALDTFGRNFLLLFLNAKSCNASSLLDRESLP